MLVMQSLFKTYIKLYKLQHFTSMAQGETLLDTGHDDVCLVMVTKGFITTVTVARF